jgi:hypothetical protein
MTFVFPILLGGLALAAIPLILHLIVRRQPKRLPFPAFRFLVQQHRSNLRKLRLRHLLLLALRVFLIVAMCLLLARPRMFQRVLGLDGERPVNAVFVFDTSASMDYRSSDSMTRLDQAKQRARELLDVLPPGSRVTIVDSANARLDQAAEWLSLADARQRIGNLKIRFANAPVTQALLRALTHVGQGDSEKQGQAGPPRLRLLAVFSDRTRASWDGAQLPQLLDKLDRLPPAYDGLIDARSQIGSLQDLLGDLRRELPPAPGRDYNEQSLLEALAALQNDLVGLSPSLAGWPENLDVSRRQTRRLARELRGQIQASEPSPGPQPAPIRSYSEKLRSALDELQRATGGAQMLFVDVGIESPVDLALVQLELPRGSQGQQEIFAEGEEFTLQAIIQAVGKDAPVRVVCQAGGATQEFAVDRVQAGQTQMIPFKIGLTPPLPPGDNVIHVQLQTEREPMPHSHHRFATVQVRPKRKVLIMVDDPERQGAFARGIAALGYAPDVKQARELTKDALKGYAAVYLLGLAEPDEKLWNILAEYVAKGGGLGVVPAGEELKTEAYNTPPAAQKLLPGTIETKSERVEEGISWNWEPPSAKYEHSFMKRFKTWKDSPSTNFFVNPRGAFVFWEVKRRPDVSMVLVEYFGGKPAVLERLFDAKSGMRGKVLLFTTPLDEQKPAWNNYDEQVTSFYLALLSQATSYLAGENVAVRLNFTLGHGETIVALPPGAPLAEPPTLRGPDLFRSLAVEPGDAQVTLRDLTVPGNYIIEGKDKETGELRRLAAFSLNVPAEECDLRKVPASELEPLFPGDAVLQPDWDRALHEMLQSYRNEPLDLIPYLMLALLLALALENLVANKFYRQEARELPR